MTKRLLCGFMLLLTALLVLCGCKGKNDYDPTALETADTLVSATNPMGSVALDETSARALLNSFPQEVLGLQKPLSDYVLKLSVTRLYDEDAVLVEAMENEQVAGTFAIQGINCYLYNASKGEYLFLTTGGALPTAPRQETTKAK